MTYINNTDMSDTLLKDNNSFFDSNWMYLVKGLGVAAVVLLPVGVHTVLRYVMPDRYCNTTAGDDHLEWLGEAMFPLQLENINGDIPTNRNNNIVVPLIAENAEAEL